MPNNGGRKNTEYNVSLNKCWDFCILQYMKSTSQKAREIQDKIFRKMTAEQKIKLTSQFFEFAKKLQKLNDRKINGNRAPFNKNS